MVSSRAFAVPLLFAMLLPALPLLQVSDGKAQFAPASPISEVQAAQAQPSFGAPPSQSSEPQAAAPPAAAIPRLVQVSGGVPAVVIPLIVPLPDGNGVLFPVPDGNGWLYPVPEIPPLKPIPDLFICRDSDGGKNYFQFGMANGRDPANRGYVGTTDFNDFCADSNTLNEYFCVADWVHSEKVGCAEGCRAGACLGEPGPDTNYCCPAGEDCVIAGVCGTNGTIKCTMRQGQNMLIRDFNSACNITLDVENGGAMGWLRLENDRILGSQNFSVKAGNISTEADDEMGVAILNCNNVAVSAGSIITEGLWSEGVFLRGVNDGRVSVGKIFVLGTANGVNIYQSNNNVVSGQDVVCAKETGVGVGDSNGNTVTFGSIRGLSPQSGGLNIGGANNNTVIVGDINSVGYEAIDVAGSTGNRITAGNIGVLGNRNGIYLYLSHNNSIKTGTVNTYGGNYANGVFIASSGGNTVMTGDITAKGEESVGIYSQLSANDLVCASHVYGGAGTCRLYEKTTLTGCENGVPIPNCANSDRNCSECSGKANCAPALRT